jgi:hypothetical protein
MSVPQRHRRDDRDENRLHRAAGEVVARTGVVESVRVFDPGRGSRRSVRVLAIAPGELVRVTEKVTRPLPHDNQEIINATRISLFSGNRCTQEDAGGGGALGRRGPAVSPAANVWNLAAGDRASSGVAATAPGERSRNGIHGPVLATRLQQHIGEIGRALSQAMQGHAPILRRLSQVPGMEIYAAQDWLAEIGVGATAFASPAQFASRVGVFPGQ